MEYFSFDIFDTIFVRNVADPKDLFLFLGHFLCDENIISIEPQEFMNIRIKAEEECRETKDSQEVSIEEIYDNMKNKLGWSSQQSEMGQKLEMDFEVKHLNVVQENVRAIRKIHDSGSNIFYISDMYLPSNFLISLLDKYGLWENGDKVYVSNEVGVNKYTGHLFTYFLNQEKILPSQVRHTGDNLHSDIKMALKLGIKSSYFSETKLSRYEKSLHEAESCSLQFRTLLVGASRLTRLQCSEIDSDRKIIWKIASSVIAPVLFGFVRWALLDAQKKGLSRLYFVARDGQILLEIARIICKTWNIEIDCRYLYGSRQAFHFPAIETIDKDVLDWILEPLDHFSIQTICNRINISPYEIAEYLSQNSFDENSWDTHIEPRDRENLYKIFQSPPVINKIVTRSRQYRKNALGYFKQEGLADNIQYGIVDIGWTGRSQRSLSRLLSLGEIYPPFGISGYYFGLDKRVKAFPTESLQGYFIDPENSESFRRRNLCHCELLEIFTAADHGGTTHYEEIDGKFSPVLRSAENTHAVSWGIQVQHAAIATFTRELTKTSYLAESSLTDWISMSEILMKSFTSDPQYEESSVFGKFKFSQDQAETIFLELAPQYKLKHIFPILKNPNTIHSFVLLPASIQRSHGLIKNILRYHGRRVRSYSKCSDAWKAINNKDYKMAKINLEQAFLDNPLLIGSRNFLKLLLEVLKFKNSKTSRL